ncbi:MAG TPA: cobalamin-binding protein [Acidobacteriaceae bacterium]|jgi:iron complex transport system substrate-binding protein|nr:cobalamin-binding protein [Acidobacteriaceae bacterium]
MKVCSLLPSATEMLFAVGAGPDVVAVTFECDFPPEARRLPQVVSSRMPPGLAPAQIDSLVRENGAEGRSLYFADMLKIDALAPDLIVLQDLCRVCAIDSPTLERDLASIHSRPLLLSLGASSLDGVISEIEQLGAAVGRREAASQLASSLRARVRRISGQGPAHQLPTRPRVLCLEWLDPLFQGGHWIPEMVALAGGDPVLATPREKSVRITWQQVHAAAPDILFVMPCGYHLADTVIQFRSLVPTFPSLWMDLPAVRHGQVFAVDGSAFFSRPGPRLVDGLEILAAIIRGTSWDHLPAESVASLAPLASA